MKQLCFIGGPMGVGEPAASQQSRLDRLPLYDALDAWNLDTSVLTPEEAAEAVLPVIRQPATGNEEGAL